MKDLAYYNGKITPADEMMCDVKTLNLLCSVLARQEASEKGCYEAILNRGRALTAAVSGFLSDG